MVAELMVMVLVLVVVVENVVVVVLVLVFVITLARDEEVPVLRTLGELQRWAKTSASPLRTF